MKKVIQITCIVFLSLIYSIAQSSRQDYELAEKSMASKDYYNAFVNYKKLADAYSDNIEYNYKAAESARLLSSFKNALYYYDIAHKHKDNNAYPLTGFWIGQVKQMQGDYNGAVSAYKSYKTERGTEDVYYSSLAEKEIKASEWAVQQVKNPVKGTTVNRMGEAVNSEYSDFASAINGDDLYFSSLRFDNLFDKTYPAKKISNILKSKKGNTAVALDYSSKVKAWDGRNIAHSAFNKDKSKVFFTVCDNLNTVDKRCDLYCAPIDTKGAWGEAIKLPDFINHPNSTQTEPNVGFNAAINKEVLYYASNREGGKGGLDLWYVIIDGAGNFSEPMNLASINTAQDDVTPFYHNATKTLYYSSKGHLGMGGYDIFQVREQANGWGTIKNMGTPINSSLDDVYFVRADKGTEAYLSSNRTGAALLDDATEACCLDIFKAQIQPCDINLKTLVYDADTKLDLLAATVKLFDVKDPSAKPIIITHDMNNLYEFPIECDREYRIEASKPGYVTENVTFNSGKPGEFTEITKKLYLKPETIQLDVLTFFTQTGEELNNCTVTLYDLDDKDWKPITLNNLNSNLSQFNLVRCHNYRVVATKNGYTTGEKTFKVDCDQSGKITQRIMLDKLLFSMLPLVLYFDNDRPNPATMASTTNLTYKQTYTAYYARKKEFMNKHSKLYDANERSGQSSAMESFFEYDVKGNKEKFEQFLGILIQELQSGKKYEIFVKGYASPLAKNDYNIRLGNRRINSIQNEFARCNGGVLKPYLKSGLLKVTQKSFGEDSAPNGINDNPKDPKSIYTIEASRERRVEIIEIKE